MTKGMPALVHPFDVVQSCGSLHHFPAYSNGTALAGLRGLLTLDTIGGGLASGAGPVVIQLDGSATAALLSGEVVQVIVSNPHVVHSGVMTASKSNAGPPEFTSQQFSRDLVTS